MKLIALGLLTVLVLASCGDDGGGSNGASGEGPTPEDLGIDPEEFAADPEGAAEDLAENLEEVQEQLGGGSATLTIGDETWEFASVLCAIGSDETRSEDWDFSLSAIQDGLQLSVNRGAPEGRFGDDINIDDIEDFENPSVSWRAPAFVLPTPENPIPGDPEPFVMVDGKNVTAQADFTDGTTDDITNSVPGTLDATCP